MSNAAFNDLAVSPEPRRVRALFISDVHLGTKGAQVEALLEFLKYYDAETIYLVGDIVDGWRLKQVWHWPQTHNDVAQKLLRKARKGARIIYVPGNHDEFLRDFYGTHFGGIEVRETAIHVAADGKRYLVIHGDAFDMVIHHAKWLAYAGDWAYALAMAVSRRVNWVRRRLGFTYWSLSSWAKQRVKHAVNFIGKFEDTLIAEAGTPWRRRHRLRPYPLPGAAPDPQFDLRELRRLGRKLHGGSRAFRRPLRDHRLGRAERTAQSAARGRHAGVAPARRLKLH